MTTSLFGKDSPPIESHEDLLDYFRSGEKPRAEWRIGTEHEKLGFYRKTRRPVPYEGPGGIRVILEAIAADFNWETTHEGDILIALTKEGAAITLEPGGQLELSGAPLATAHDTCGELRDHLGQLRRISEESGVVWMALGRNPLIPNGEMPWMPKERYGIMRDYLPRKGSSAIDMMVGTGTVQTNLDYSDEADMARKLRVATAIAPFLTALFANSPFAEGRVTGDLSTRGRIWTATDPERCGVVPGVLGEGFGYREYTEWALDTPMFFIHRDGHYLNYAGRSFREFLEKGLDGYVATHEDWELHLTTLFPEARLKTFIELRMVDIGPTSMICALAALTRGIFYDDAALAEAGHLFAGVAESDYPHLWLEAARAGLRAEFGGRPFQEWAKELLDIAEGGLTRLDARDDGGDNEVKYLAPLRQIVTSGNTQADLLVNLWNGEWNHSVEPLFSSEFII